MKFVFQSVSITDEKKPGAKQGYQKAVVIYTYNGEPRKQTIVSFSNPAIFKQIQELEQGQEIEVEVIKNAGGFNEWKSVTVGGNSGSTGGNQTGTPSAASGATTGSTGVARVTGSNYENKEERAARQVLIVKQSSLSAAVASLTPGAKAPLSVEEVIERAQAFVDFVFEQDAEDVE
jgi:hypothetical protein